MFNKKNLQKAGVLMSYALLLYTTIISILGKANTVDKIYMWTCYLLLVITLLVKFSCKIATIIIQYKSYIKYRREFNYLQAIHKKRYKLYFMENRELLDKYSVEIADHGLALIKAGEECISKQLLNKKQMMAIGDMINQTVSMMTTEKPNNGA